MDLLDVISEADSRLAELNSELERDVSKFDGDAAKTIKALTLLIGKTSEALLLVSQAKESLELKEALRRQREELEALRD